MSTSQLTDSSKNECFIFNLTPYDIMQSSERILKKDDKELIDGKWLIEDAYKDTLCGWLASGAITWSESLSDKYGENYDRSLLKQERRLEDQKMEEKDRDLIGVAIAIQEIKTKLNLGDSVESNKIATFIALNAPQLGFTQSLPFKTASVTREHGCVQTRAWWTLNIWRDSSSDAVKIKIRQQLKVKVGDEGGTERDGVYTELEFAVKYQKDTNPPWDMDISAPQGKLIIGDAVNDQARSVIVEKLQGLLGNTGSRNENTVPKYPTDTERQ